MLCKISWKKIAKLTLTGFIDDDDDGFLHTGSETAFGGLFIGSNV